MLASFEVMSMSAITDMNHMILDPAPYQPYNPKPYTLNP